MLKSSLGCYRGRPTLFLEPQQKQQQRQEKQECLDSEKMWQYEEEEFGADDPAYVFGTVYREKMSGLLKSKFFNDAYQYVWRTVALLLKQSQLREVHVPPCGPLTREGLQRVFHTETAEYQLQWMPFRATQREFLCFLTYGDEKRSVFVDGTGRMEWIEIENVSGDDVYKGSVFEALREPFSSSSSEASASTSSTAQEEEEKKEEGDRNERKTRTPEKEEAGNEEEKKRKTKREVRESEGEGEEETVNSKRQRISSSSSLSSSAGNGTFESKQERKTIRDILPSFSSSSSSVPPKEKEEEDEKQKQKKKKKEGAWKVGRSKRSQRHCNVWLRDTLVWAGRNVCDQTLPKRIGYIDYIVHDIDLPAKHHHSTPRQDVNDEDAEKKKENVTRDSSSSLSSSSSSISQVRLKRISTMTLCDSMSVLLDTVPYFKTYLPAYVSAEIRHDTTTTTTTTSTTEKRRGRGTTRNLLENGDKGIVDLNHETYGDRCRLWLVPVASSYTLCNTTEEEKKRQEGEEEERTKKKKNKNNSTRSLPLSFPLYEITEHVTFLCRTRFEGREIVCQTLADPSHRSLICKIMYVPNDPVHAQLSHLDRTTSVVYATLILGVDKKWTLERVVRNVTTSEKNNSTRTELQRRFEWVSRAEYVTFLRTIR